MIEGKQARFDWLDIFWLAFLAGLAILPPVIEIHKQLVLIAIGIVQLAESHLLTRWPNFGRSLAVLLKIFLATLLLAHTGSEPAINSSYFPIYFVPIVTAGVYFGMWATLGWTLLASAAYCSYLYPAMQEYQPTAESIGLLAIRILFFFLVAMVVNRFAIENRKQTKRYQSLAQELAETNSQLLKAQAEARRSERLAALGQLSAGLAHEIRNPLGVIKGSAEMLNQKLDSSNPLAGELAGYISSEVNRLSTLVTRFLNFARPLRAEVKPCSVTEVLDRALKSVSELWKGGPVKIERQYQAGLPLVPVDEGLFEQAFINLIQNAYEAMGEKGGVLQVSATQTNSDPGGIEIRIKDTGPGIPAEQREQIFNPFVTTKATGVGLGLSIVSQIMDEHHGWLRLEDTPDGGACFVAFFPLAESSIPVRSARMAN